MAVILLLFAQWAPMLVTMIFAAFFAFCIAVYTYQKSQFGYTTTALFLLSAAAVWIIEWNEDQPDNWWHAFHTTSMVLFMCAALSILLPDIYPAVFRSYAKTATHTAARILVFKVSVALLLLTLAAFVHQLAESLQKSPSLTLYASTVTECAPVIHRYTNITLFDTTIDVECTSTVWNLIRYNILLIVQVYTMYLLTTEIQKFATPFILAEAVLWSLASITQFNTLERCYSLRTNTLILVIIAFVVHTMRVVNGHTITPPVVNVASADKHCTYMSGRKLKLKL